MSEVGKSGMYCRICHVTLQSKQGLKTHFSRKHPGQAISPDGGDPVPLLPLSAVQEENKKPTDCNTVPLEPSKPPAPKSKRGRKPKHVLLPPSSPTSVSTNVTSDKKESEEKKEEQKRPESVFMKELQHVVIDHIEGRPITSWPLSFVETQEACLTIATELLEIKIEYETLKEEANVVPRMCINEDIITNIFQWKIKHEKEEKIDMSKLPGHVLDVLVSQKFVATVQDKEGHTCMAWYDENGSLVLELLERRDSENELYTKIAKHLSNVIQRSLFMMNSNK